MVRWISLALAAGALAAPTRNGARQAEDVMAVRAVRFYRPDSRQTLVKAFVQIPYVLFAGDGGSGGGDVVTYSVTVKVSDSTGLGLLQESWTNHLPSAIARSGVTGLEMLEFPVLAGSYVLDVTVEDSLTGRKAYAKAKVEGYRSPPALSDLLLSPEIRVAAAGDTVPKPGELRLGNALVTGAVELHLTPLKSEAYYLLEAYSTEAASGTLSVSIRDSVGNPILKTPAAVVNVPAGGGVLKGQLDLTGLPEGRYAMAVTVQLGGVTTERQEPLTMAGLEETLAKEAARVEQEQRTDAGYFGAMNEAQLDSAAGPLLYIATPADGLNLYKDLTVEGKRKWLTEFWTRRDTSPGPERNESRENFYAAIDYANQQFKESGRRATPGWRSDRGRIYAKYGPYDEYLDRVAVGRAPNYQVWRYSKQKGLYFIFVDKSNLGAYQLIYTNDLTEVSRPDWQDILTPDGVVDVGRWLGVNFFGSSGVQN
jgi:GWxTD domain-containing protein